MEQILLTNKQGKYYKLLEIKSLPIAWEVDEAYKKFETFIKLIVIDTLTGKLEILDWEENKDLLFQYLPPDSNTKTNIVNDCGYGYNF